MKTFTAPEMEFIAFEVEDIVTVSNLNDVVENDDGSVGLPWG